MTDTPSGRRLPRPSPLVLMLLGMGLIIGGLLWLISARPKPDFAEAPPAAVSSARSDAAAFNAATKDADARRLKGPQN